MLFFSGNRNTHHSFLSLLESILPPPIMSGFPRISDMCSPAFVYLVVSGIVVCFVFMQNLYNTNMLKAGSYSFRVPNTMLVFAIKMVWVLFWAYVLNLICRDGHSTLAWILVLVPWIVTAMLVMLIILNR